MRSFSSYFHNIRANFASPCNRPRALLTEFPAPESFLRSHSVYPIAAPTGDSPAPSEPMSPNISLPQGDESPYLIPAQEVPAPDPEPSDALRPRVTFGANEVYTFSLPSESPIMDSTSPRDSDASVPDEFPSPVESASVGLDSRARRQLAQFVSDGRISEW